MMRVQIAVSIASVEWSYRPTQVVTVGTQFTPDEIPRETALAWLASGVAVPVKDAPDVATSAPVESAVLPRPRRSGRS